MTGERIHRMSLSPERQAIANALAVFAQRHQKTHPELFIVEAMDLAIVQYLAVDRLPLNRNPTPEHHFPPLHDRPGLRTT